MVSAAQASDDSAAPLSGRDRRPAPPVQPAHRIAATSSLAGASLVPDAGPPESHSFLRNSTASDNSLGIDMWGAVSDSGTAAGGAGRNAGGGGGGGGGILHSGQPAARVRQSLMPAGMGSAQRVPAAAAGSITGAAAAGGAGSTAGQGTGHGAARLEGAQRVLNQHPSAGASAGSMDQSSAYRDVKTRYDRAGWRAAPCLVLSCLVCK